jgi:hypothetical protein
MTTQAPHGPDAAVPPQPAYPTTPPWATPPPAGPAAYPPYAPYGQLLVPYPEEMQNAARPQPPSWWPVVAWTFIFGIFGAVAASRRADRARRGRNSVAPYWVAWAVTLAVGGVLWLAGVAVGVPVYLNWREDMVTDVVASNLVHDGRLAETAEVTATKAACDPVGPRDPAGQRRYDCTLTLQDGRTAALTVTADADGVWTPVPVRK